MADAATGIPPRIRTRASLESQAPLSDLAEIAMRGDLPEPTAVRVRSIAARNSPELMPPIFDALVRLRMAGVPHEEIARRFGVHPRTEYRWWERARPWLRERFVDLDPAEVWYVRCEEINNGTTQWGVLRDVGDGLRGSSLGLPGFRVHIPTKRGVAS